MRGRRGVLAYPFSLAAIFVFTALLVFALFRLWNTEAALRTQVGDNMLWAISQAQIATQQLDLAIAHARLGETEADMLGLRYDLLLSRLTLLKQGPQRRYLTDIGHFDSIDALSGEVTAQEETVLSAAELSDGEARAVQDLLAELAGETGRAANRAMVAQWNNVGAQLDRQHETVLQVIAMVMTILAIGAFISWRMLAALQAEQRAQISLLREQEIREAYGGFVALVSHQFRTPLSIIDASMQRILRKGEAMEREEIEQRARRAREIVRRLTELVQATLDSMKLEAGQIEIQRCECDIVAELANARESQLEVRSGRVIDIDVGNEVPARVMTDPLLVHQILSNLLANALVYSPQTEAVTTRVYASNNHLRIAVTDTGIGIGEDEKEMLFQPFFRTETAKARNGVGMGLHLSRRLARMLGGDLTFTSSRGVGSTFTLELPL